MRGRRRGYLEYLSVDLAVLLKWIIKMCLIVWTETNGLKHGALASHSAHCNGYPGYEVIFDCVPNYQHLNKRSISFSQFVYAADEVNIL